MSRRFSEIRNSKLIGTDGLVGDVIDVLVEDETWNVRYIVVGLENTGPVRKVLISPAAIESFGSTKNTITTKLNSTQVNNSPLLDWNAPVSRQYEEALVDYYGWPIYWLGRAAQISPQFLMGMADGQAADSVEDNQAANLRSAAEICDYKIRTIDGYAGVLKDLIIRRSSWTVAFATAEPSSWKSAQSTMFSTRHIESVDWTNREIVVDLPKYSLNTVLTRDAKAHPSITGEPLSSQPFRTA